MNEISLDADKWQSADDFYNAILLALGAPDWHGRNLDAIQETLGCDDTNALRQPIKIVVYGTEEVPPSVRRCLDGLSNVVTDLRHRKQAKLWISWRRERRPQ